MKQLYLEYLALLQHAVMYTLFVNLVSVLILIDRRFNSIVIQISIRQYQTLICILYL